MKPSKNKQPKHPHHNVSVSTEKKPRSAVVVTETHKVVAWRFSLADRDGPFAWHLCDDHVRLHEVLKRFGDMEGQTWSEMAKGGSHLVDVKDLCKEARKRLEAIGQDDVGHLYSLRIGGKPRVWGVQDGSLLKVLWWDPEHQVCPSNKKNT